MRALKLFTLLVLSSPLPALAQDQADPALVGELMAFHGSKAIVEVMTTHCYETTGLDNAYKDAAANWYLRNIGYLDLADRVAVLSARPSVIARTIATELPRPRDSIVTRELPRFLELRHTLLAMLLERPQDG